MDETFYLYRCEYCLMFFISNKEEKDSIVLNATQARAWIEAKDKLGYKLTVIQQQLFKELK